METKTMVTNMGGSIKEKVKRGPKGPRRHPLKQALLLTCNFSSPQRSHYAVLVPDPWVQLEPEWSHGQASLNDGLRAHTEGAFKVPKAWP